MSVAKMYEWEHIHVSFPLMLPSRVLHLKPLAMGRLGSAVMKQSQFLTPQTLDLPSSSRILPHHRKARCASLIPEKRLRQSPWSYLSTSGRASSPLPSSLQATLNRRRSSEYPSLKRTTLIGLTQRTGKLLNRRKSARQGTNRQPKANGAWGNQSLKLSLRPGEAMNHKTSCPVTHP